MSACVARRWTAFGQHQLAEAAVHTWVTAGSLAVEVDTGQVIAEVVGMDHDCRAVEVADHTRHTVEEAGAHCHARLCVPGRTPALGY